jgi:DNA-binding MurR/RpiR family transcriptional regulator
VSRLTDAIADSYGALSPQEQRVADLIRSRPEDIALYNSSELAGLAGVSKATVSRLFRRLGFSGSQEVRESLRAQRTAGVPIDLARRQGMDERLAAQLRHDLENLGRLYQTLDARGVTEIADRIAAAPRVLVLGFRSGFPLALHLRQQLAQARDGVRVGPEPGQSVGEELEGLEAGDVVLLVGVQRRPAGFGRLVQAVAESPATGVLFGDPSARPYAAALDWTLEFPLASPSAFDSYAAAASLVSLLAGAVLAALGPAGADRVVGIRGRYAALGELENP